MKEQSVHRYLMQTLKQLEAAIPPPAKTHHAITFARYGSDELGWEDQLAIKVYDGATTHCLFMDDSDFEMTPEELVNDIVTNIRKKAS